MVIWHAQNPPVSTLKTMGSVHVTCFRHLIYLCYIPHLGWFYTMHWKHHDNIPYELHLVGYIHRCHEHLNIMLNLNLNLGPQIT